MRLLNRLFFLFMDKIRRTVVFGRQHTLVMPTFLSFSCFIIVVLLSISIWFSASVNTSLKAAVYETAAHQTVLSADSLRQTFNDFIALSARLSLLDSIDPQAFHSSSYEAFQSLRQYDFAAFKYSDLIIYYRDNPLLLSVKGTAKMEVIFPEVSDYGTFTNFLKSIQGTTLLSTAAFGAGRTDSKLILAQPLTNQALAMFTLNYSSLYSMLGFPTEAISDVGIMRFLLDRSGVPLWANVSPDNETLNAIDHYMLNTEYQPVVISGVEYLYSFSYISHGVTLVVLNKVNTQFDNVNTAILVLGLLCVLLVITGILLLIFSIRRGYAPIASLVGDIRNNMPSQNSLPTSDIGMLQQVYSQYSLLVRERSQRTALLSSEQLRDLFILRIICGQYSDPEQVTNLFHWMNIELHYRCYFACLLLFDQIPSDEERRNIETNLYCITWEELTCYFCFTPDGHSAVGLVNVPTTDPATLHIFGTKLLLQLQHVIPATIGLGHIYESIDSLGKSYLEAHAALDYRLIKGKNTCITYDEINFTKTNDPVYPIQLLDAYVACLRSWNAVAIQEKLYDIIDFIHHNNLSLQEVKCICFELTSSFLKEINNLNNLQSYHENATFDVFNIAEYASVAELAQKIIDFSQTIHQYIEESKARCRDNLVAQCIANIEDNLSNTQFSLSLLAEQLGVTSQTLRRRFKEATGQTLSNFLTTQRLKHAMELLIKTDLDLSSICIQCGYLDPSSFSRLFKEEIGVSPGKYREIHRP